MKCLQNMERITVPSELVLDMMKLYKFNGKEAYYANVFKRDIANIEKEVIEKDAHFFVRIMNLKITEPRLKQIICKDASPKNKDELLASNIKEIFVLLHEKIEDFEPIPLDCLNMAKMFFRNINNIRFRVEDEKVDRMLGVSRKKIKKETEVEEMLNKFSSMYKSEEYETTMLVVNFFIDFYNVKPFEEHNDDANKYLSYLYLYIFLFHYGFDQFRYASFFEKIYEKLSLFEGAIKQSNFNWEEGYAQTLPLERFLISIMQSNYREIEHNLHKYEFEVTLNKSDDVEATILKWNGDVFTKDEIRKVHPYVSVQTIDRTLKRLRDEDKIRPLGTGRSAKWMKVYKISTSFNAEQLELLFPEEKEKNKK